MKKTMNSIQSSHFVEDRLDMDIRFVEWHSALSNSPHSPMQTLRRITPTSYAFVRAALTEATLDVLLYMTPHYRREMLSSVAAQLNALYLQATEQNAGRPLNITLFGHSLGSVICYELLRLQQSPEMESADMRLNFVPTRLFMAGSPLGIFAALRPTEGYAWVCCNDICVSYRFCSYILVISLVSFG